MKNTHCKLFLNVCLMLGTIFFLSCGGDDDSPLNENDQKEDDGQKNETVIESVSNFTAKETNKANELLLEWKNPSGIVAVEISYFLEENGESPAIVNVRVYGEKNSKYTLQLPEFGTYRLTRI